MEEFSIEHYASPNGANGTNQSKPHPPTTFSLFLPEFNLTTNKVKHNAVTAKKLAQQFLGRGLHPKTKKPYIKIVSPICMDRSRKDDCYSPESFKDILYKLTSQFKGYTLVIDIVPTGELDGWNILLSQRLKQRKQSLEGIGVNGPYSDATTLAREQGRQKAENWARALKPVVDDLNKKGHIITIKHWPDAFPNNDEAKDIRQQLGTLYSEERAFTSLIDSTILIFLDRLRKHQDSLTLDIAQPCILNYLFEELAFQVYLATNFEDVYDFHLYEMDDVAPKLTQTTLYYTRHQGDNNSNQTKPFLLEFKLNKVPSQTSQHKSSFTANVGALTETTEQDDFFRVAEEIVFKSVMKRDEKLSPEEEVIKNVFWRIINAKKEQIKAHNLETDPLGVNPMDTGGDTDSNNSSESTSPKGNEVVMIPGTGHQ